MSTFLITALYLPPLIRLYLISYVLEIFLKYLMILVLCSYLIVGARKLNGNLMTYMTWKYWDSLKSDKMASSLLIKAQPKASVWRSFLWGRLVSPKKKILAEKPIPSGQHSGNMLRAPIFNADFHLIHIFNTI